MLNEFYSAQGFWNSLASRTPPVSFLAEIASSGEHGVIPHLAPLLLHRSEVVRDATASCIGKLYTGMSSGEIAQLEQLCRDEWAYDSTALGPWRKLKPGRVASLVSHLRREVLPGVASFHNSGYVREAAVKALSDINDGSEVPFLLLRLNDWVPEIRRIAAEAVLKRLSREYAFHFVRHFRLVLRLRSCGRDDHKPLVARITSFLKSPESFRAVSEGVSSPDRELRREFFRLAVEGAGEDQTKLLERVIGDRDPIVRLWAARDLLPQMGSSELRQPIELLRRDKSRPVRCEGLNLWVSKFPEDALPAIDDALFDSHGSVRALAQYWMEKVQPDLNLAEVYREALKELDQKRLRAAILGLAETGKAEDADLLSGYLDNARPALRKAALRAIAILNREAFAQQLLEGLSDQQPGVSREAARGMRPIAGSFHDQLLSLFRSSPLRHVRRNAFLLLLGLPFWKRGIFLFEAIRDFDNQIVTHGQTALRNWTDRSRGMATPPMKNELQQLRDALKASSGMLGEEAVRELEFSFRTLE